ncbi:MAG: hypothetical protein U0T32_11085 [Chitinophagales bacterium]
MKNLIRAFVVACLCMGTLQGWGQTNPTAQTLPYTQNFSSFTGAITTYPAGWQGWNLTGSLGTSYITTTPASDRALTSVNNTLTAAHVGDMTGKMGLYSSSGTVVAACLAINTTGLTSISVSYDAATQRTENTRLNELGLQYRVGTSGAFTNVSGSGYQNQLTPTNTTGTGAVAGQTISVTLPVVCEGQANVQLRWTIRDVSGSGNRPGFSIDNISISGTAPSNVTISSPSQVAAQYVYPNTTNNIISAIQVANTTGSSINLTGATFNLTGTYLAADLATSNALKVYYTTTNTFSTTTLLGSKATSIAAGSGESVTLTGLSQAIANNATGYLWLTADVNTGATSGRTITASATAVGDIVVSAGTKGSSATAGGTQTISAVPTITIGSLSPAGPYCQGATVSVPFTILGGSFNTGTTFTAQIGTSSFSANTANIGSGTTSPLSCTIPVGQLAGGTLYSIRVNASSPAVNGSSTTFTLNSIPTVTYPSTAVCNNSSITGITVSPNPSGTFNTPSSGTVTYNSGTTDYTYTPVSSFTGTVPLTYTLSGCASTAQNISVNASATTPVFPATSGNNNKTSICTGSSGLTYSVTAQTGATYAWTLPSGWVVTGGATNQITVTTIGASGNISCQVTQAGCGSASASLAVAVTTTPTQPSVITPPSTICASTAGNVFSVVNTVGVTYTWSVSGTAWSIPVASTTNSVTVTSGAAGNNGTLNVTATLNGCNSTVRTLSSIASSAPSAPTVSIANTNAAICVNAAQTFTSSTTNAGTPSYQWNLNGSPISGETNSTYSAPANTLSNGDIVSLNITATGSCITSTTASSNQISAQKLAHTPTTIWTESFGTGSTTLTLTYAGYTNGKGLTFACNTTGNSLDIRTTGVSPAGGSNVFFPTYSSGSSTKFLVISGINTTLPGSFPNKLSFYFGSNNTAGTYTSNDFQVEYSLDGTNYYPMTFPNIVTTGSPAWTPSAVTVDQTLPLGSNVRVRFTSSSQSFRLDDIKLVGYTTADAAITPSVTPEFCATGTVQLVSSPTATPALTYAWSASPASPTFLSSTSVSNPTATNVTTTRNYTLTITDGFGCKSTASQTVTINPLPSAAPSSNTPVCVGDAINLDANETGGTGAFTYSWSGPDSYTNTSTGTPSLTATASSGGTYNVTVTDSKNCSASASTAVVVNALPAASASNDGPFCVGDNITLHALPNGATTYAWSGPSSYAVANVQNPTRNSATTAMAGTYNVTVTDANGCSASASTAVVVNTPPIASASNGGAVCAGGSISLSALPNGATTYAWSGPSAYTVANNQNPTRTGASTAMAGAYTVTVTDANGCSATASTSVAVNTCGPNTWLGVTTDWNNHLNWSTDTVPNSCAHNLVIPNLANDPIISTPINVGNIEIQNGAQLTLNSTLSICGALTGGSSSNALVIGTSELRLVGTGAQQITGKINANTVRVNNTSTGVTVAAAGDLSVNTALILQKGNFTNSGAVTLKSNATTTAYLDNFTSTTAGTYTGNLTVERYISNAANGYRDISSPVNAKVGGLADDFSIFGQNGVQCWYAYNPYPNVQVYNEALTIATGVYDEGFISYTGTSNALTAMKGVAIRTYAGAPFTLDLTGAPYTGAKSISITKTTSPTPSADGWNLIGNPYPSPVSWSSLKALNAGKTDGSYYVYKTTGEYTGNWGSHNGVTGVNGATNEIASMQGFYVKAASSTTFAANNASRVANETTAFFKTDDVQPDEIRLLLSNNVNSDEVVTYTDPNATSNYDSGLDALKMSGGSTVYMSVKQGGQEMAINVIDVVNAQTELPLVLWARDTGAYTFSATELNLTTLIAYLKDATTNTLTDLRTNTPTLQLNGGQTYDGRYSIVFEDVKNTTGIVNTKESNIQIYAVEGNVIVQRSSNSNANITITNMLGQTVVETMAETTKTIIPVDNTNPWYAIVKVQEAGKVKVSKVLIR